MSRSSEWAGKVLVLLRGGNTAAAIAQIKVAPSVRDLKALQAMVSVPPLGGRWPEVETAISDNLALLSAPRLHRSP
jgi:hypothetical protein